MTTDSPDQTQLSLTLRILIAAARGSAIGAAVMLLSYIRHPYEGIGQAIGAGVLLGAVISLVLMATKSWRTDLIGTYASTTVAGVAAGLVGGAVLAISDPAEPGKALAFGAFMGLCLGLALGVGLRRWKDPS